MENVSLYCHYVKSTEMDKHMDHRVLVGLTQFVPSNFRHTITHRPSNFPWEVLAPHCLHCQTQVLRSFELQNTPPPHFLNLFTPQKPYRIESTNTNVPGTFASDRLRDEHKRSENVRGRPWEMCTNVQRTFAGGIELMFIDMICRTVTRLKIVLHILKT